MEKLKVIVGLGKTGLSYARHLAARGERFAVADSNPAPDGLDELMQIAPGTTFGDLTAATLESAEQILLSPGVPRAHEAVRSAIERGVPVTGDVDMFGELVTRPVVAITGTNGKSTVTAMMGALAAAAGRNAGVGGNIGTPCLDLLDEDVEVYLLEVSSYQLEVATALPCEVAVVLNLAPDHLDRYPSLDDYYATKANIYRKAKIAVLSRDLDYPFEISAGTSVIDFGASEPQDEKSFGMRTVDGERPRLWAMSMALSRPVRATSRRTAGRRLNSDATCS